jgi:hypothetical protein
VDLIWHRRQNLRMILRFWSELWETSSVSEQNGKALGKKRLKK